MFIFHHLPRKVTKKRRSLVGKRRKTRQSSGKKMKTKRKMRMKRRR